MEGLLQAAKQAGIKKCIVAIILEKNETILLLEPKHLGIQKAYEFVKSEVAAHETLQQAICRASMEQVNLSIKEIKRFLTFKDSLDLVRTFYFVAQVHDPEDIRLKVDASYAWVDLLESFGYPIQETTREILDLYRRVK